MEIFTISTPPSWYLPRSDQAEAMGLNKGLCSLSVPNLANQGRLVKNAASCYDVIHRKDAKKRTSLPRTSISQETPVQIPDMTTKDSRLRLQGQAVRLKVSAEVHDHQIRLKDRLSLGVAGKWVSAALRSHVLPRTGDLSESLKVDLFRSRSVDPSRHPPAGFSSNYLSLSRSCSDDDVTETVTPLSTSPMEPSHQETRMLAARRPGSASAQGSIGPIGASREEPEFIKMPCGVVADEVEEQTEKFKDTGSSEEHDAANEPRHQLRHKYGCYFRQEVNDTPFEARLFNRIGLKDDANDSCGGDCLTNVTHVCHVYKGFLTLTDVLRGTVSVAAPSGRLVHDLLTKPRSEPWCACVAPSGHLAVTFRRLGCVAVWSDKGSLVREFGYGVLRCPTGIACDRRGRFVVTDDKSNLVALFTASGEFIKYLTGSGRGETSSDRSSGEVRNVSEDKEDGLSGDRDRRPARTRFATTTDRTSYMSSRVKDRPGTDDPNHDVVIGDTSDIRLKREDEGTPHVFSQPRYVCIAPSGKIIVSDSGSHSLKIFDPDGHFLRAVGGFGSGDGQLKAPYGVCCDQHDNIFVADYYNDRVSVFSIEGEFLQNVLTSSSGLSRPKSVALRPAHDRKLYVAHGGLRSTEVLMYRLLRKDGGQQSVALKLDF